MHTPTIDDIISTTHNALSHLQQHRDKRHPHLMVEARIADHIERHNSAVRCNVGYEQVETGTAQILTVHNPDGTLAGRGVTMPAESTTWWLFDGSTCTRVSMTAFSHRFVTSQMRAAS